MGLTVLDAGVVIGVRDGADAHHDSAVVALRAARARGDGVAIPASALAEVLVVPARHGRAALARARAVVSGLPVQVLALDDDVAAEAALLRAQHASLRLPDALVIATARVHAADVLVTTDRRWPTKRALKFAGKLVVL